MESVGFFILMVLGAVVVGLPFLYVKTITYNYIGRKLNEGARKETNMNGKWGEK